VISVEELSGYLFEDHSNKEVLVQPNSSFHQLLKSRIQWEIISASLGIQFLRNRRKSPKRDSVELVRKGFGSSVRLPQVSFSPLTALVRLKWILLFADCDSGIKSSEVRAVLGMGAVPAMEKKHAVWRVMSSSRTMRLSAATFTPLRCCLRYPLGISLDKLCGHRTSHKGGTMCRHSTI
jgi:hypothetical protein